MKLLDRFGEKLGTVHWKFGRSENRSGDVNINSQVSASELGLEYGTKYGVKLLSAGINGPIGDDPVPCIVETYSKEARFTIPSEVIRENDIKPGHSVHVSVFELDEPEQIQINPGSDSGTDASEIGSLVDDALDHKDELENKLNEIQDKLQDA